MISVVFSLLLIAVGRCLAQSSTDVVVEEDPEVVDTRQVTVMGNNPQWTRVAGVQANTLIKVYADGTVKFGPRSSTDTAEAGVEGNSFFAWTQGIFGSDWESQIANPSNYPNMVKRAFGTSGNVNFNQGGVWIKIVDADNKEPIAAPNLWYYWAATLNKAGFMADRQVVVYAKAHDGGRDPEATSSYDDNTGSYRVWLQLSKPERVKWTFD